MAHPTLLLKNKFMVSTDVLYHVAILCTFGICSPFLAAIITICLIMKLLTWVMLLGRFLSFRFSRIHGQDDGYAEKRSSIQMRSFSTMGGDNYRPKSEKIVIDNAIAALSEGCISIIEVFDVAIWPIIWSSCLFFATLTFDIAADEVVSARSGLYAL